VIGGAGGNASICCAPPPDGGGGTGGGDAAGTPDATSGTDGTIPVDAKRARDSAMDSGHGDGASDGSASPETGHMDSGTDANNQGDGGQGDGALTCATGPSCHVASDCPASATACVTDTCTSGCCGTVNATAGAACSDNGGKLCDGAGTCVACLEATDCPAQASLCKVNACDAAVHTCGTTDAPAGTTCTDNGGTTCNATGTCVASHCADGILDDGETDVDCGGTCGATCNTSAKCTVGGDCVSKVCDATTLLCVAPTCADGVLNGDETDVDCGGGSFDGNTPCPKCADKDHCQLNTDCVNNLCFGTGPGTCVSCMDGVKDGNETGVDCGGAQCDAQNKTCATGQGCAVASDCTTGFCQASMTCALRPLGQSCTSGSQCAGGNCISGFCCNTACSGACQACSMALTGLGNGTCGSVGNGTACNDGNLCSLASACVSGVCTETAAVTCTASDQCHIAGTCNPVTGACSNPSAADGTSCNDGNPCDTNDVCASGTCTAGTTTTCSTGLCGTSLSAFTGTQTTGWVFNGDASYDSGTNTVVLVDGTNTGNGEAGTVIYKDPIVADAFTVTFDFLFTTTNGRADGIAFMLETDANTSVGQAYGGLGVMGLDGYGVELDIFDSGPCDPGNGNHAGIDLLSACSTNGGIPSPIATSGDLYTPIAAGDNGVGDLADGSWRTTRITLTSGQLSASITDPSTGSPIAIPNMQNVALPGFVAGTKYYFGFGAGAGSNGLYSRAQIRNVSVTFGTTHCL
jgi:hypothetical protein